MDLLDPPIVAAALMLGVATLLVGLRVSAGEQRWSQTSSFGRYGLLLFACGPACGYLITGKAAETAGITGFVVVVQWLGVLFWIVATGAFLMGVVMITIVLLHKRLTARAAARTENRQR